MSKTDPSPLNSLKESMESVRRLQTNSITAMVLMAVGVVIIVGSLFYSIQRLGPLEEKIKEKEIAVGLLKEQNKSLVDSIELNKNSLYSLSAKINSINQSLEFAKKEKYSIENAMIKAKNEMIKLEVDIRKLKLEKKNLQDDIQEAQMENDTTHQNADSNYLRVVASRDSLLKVLQSYQQQNKIKAEIAVSKVEVYDKGGKRYCSLAITIEGNDIDQITSVNYTLGGGFKPSDELSNSDKGFYYRVGAYRDFRVDARLTLGNKTEFISKVIQVAKVCPELNP